MLRRFDVHYKRGRQYVHSPDAAYQAKLARIAEAIQQVLTQPARYVLLYADEFTYYRRPSIANAYGQAGQDDIRANTGWLSNTKRRIAAGLNFLTGQLHAWQRASFRRSTLLRFLLSLETVYPEADTIFVALDNWPVHFHPDLLHGLLGSRIVLLRLPTYAPWTNPIEKVWRKLFQEKLHLHRLTDDWQHLQASIDAWLAQFAQPSPDLLRYVGLA
jgi:hypothetical protein